MEIECDYNDSRCVKYSCYVHTSSITEPSTAVKSFNGGHRSGKGNGDVEAVWFSCTTVEYFPINLQMHFANMKILTINQCGLKEISRDDLRGLGRLVDLDLSKNELITLPNDLFVDMPNLIRVYMYENKIEFASSKLIEPLANNGLEYFSLRGNTSIDTWFNAESSANISIEDFMAEIDEMCKHPSQLKASSDVTAYHSSVNEFLVQPDPELIAEASTVQGNCETEGTGLDILKGFNELRKSSQLTDYVIVAGPKEFRVHKAVLAIQSPVFAKMFASKWINRCISKNWSAEVVEAFLDYFYERKRPDKRNVVEVFKLAVQYKVAKLTAICEEIVRDNLSAFEIYKLASSSNWSELKVAAFRELQGIFGNELSDDLMEQPEKLQEIVEAKRVLDKLMGK